MPRRPRLRPPTRRDRRDRPFLPHCRTCQKAPAPGPSSFLEIPDDPPRSHQTPLQGCEASRLRSVRAAALAARGLPATKHPVRIIAVPELRRASSSRMRGAGGDIVHGAGNERGRNCCPAGE